VPEIIDIQFALAFVTGVDTVTLTQEVRGAIVSFVNSLGVNQPLLRNDLGAVLTRFRSSGVIPTEGSILVPAGDLFPSVQGRTLRTRIENVQPV